MSKPAEALYTKDFLLATIASVFVGGYSILLLTLTLMYGNDAGFTAAAAGLLSSVFAFASLGMRPFSGLLCDRFPKKRLLVLSAVGYTVLPLLFLAELPYGVLLGARIVQGFCMGVASTAVAAIATSFIPKSRFTEGVSIFGVGMSACSAVAPGIGLWILAHFGYTGVFLYSSFTGLLIIALVLPIRCHETMEKPQSRPRLGELLRGLYEPTALYSAACTLFLAVMQITVMQFLSYYTASRGVNGTYAFYTLSAVAVVAVRLAIGRVSGAKADRVILLAGTLILAAGYGGLHLLFPTALSLGILSVLYGCGHSMSGIVLNSMALAEAPPERMGAANATYLAASDLGYAVGPLLWNSYCARYGYSQIYLLASIGVLVLFLIFLFAPKNNKRE